MHFQTFSLVLKKHTPKNPWFCCYSFQNCFVHDLCYVCNNHAKFEFKCIRIYWELQLTFKPFCHRIISYKCILTSQSAFCTLCLSMYITTIQSEWQFYFSKTLWQLGQGHWNYYRTVNPNSSYNQAKFENLVFIVSVKGSPLKFSSGMMFKSRWLTLSQTHTQYCSLHIYRIFHVN